MKAFRRGSTQTSVGRSTTTTGAVPVISTLPSKEMIAQRAYQKWLEGGCPCDTDVQNWLEAEAELKGELSERRRV